MIIDARIRPPFGGFLDMAIPYNIDIIAPFSKGLGLEVAKSGKNKSVDEMIAEMKAADVVKGILVGRQSPGFGSAKNDDIATLINKYPGRFVGIGGIHPLPLDSALKEIDRCINVLKFAGVALEPGVASPPMYPDDKNYYPIYYTCQELDIPVYLTVSGFVGPNIGYADPVHVDQVAADFPKLQIVVAHAAYPYVHQMLYSAWYRPNIYLCPDLYANMPGLNEFVVAANLFLEDRLVFGSSYPIASFESIIAAYRKMPFKEGVLEKLMYKNIARVLKLDVTEAKEAKKPAVEEEQIYYSAPSPFASIFESKLEQ